MKVQILLAYFLVNLLIGTFVFLYGFFPLSYVTTERAHRGQLPTEINGTP